MRRDRLHHRENTQNQAFESTQKNEKRRRQPLGVTECEVRVGGAEAGTQVLRTKRRNPWATTRGQAYTLNEAEVSPYNIHYMNEMTIPTGESPRERTHRNQARATVRDDEEVLVTEEIQHIV